MSTFHRTTAEMVTPRPPPPLSRGVIGWLRANLFSSWFNAAMTLLAVYLLWLLVPGILRWGLLDADFAGTT